VLERSLALRRAYADEASMRRQLDVLFREPAAAYQFSAPRPRIRGSQPVTPQLHAVTTW
jgi:hypothetical protein